MLSCSRGATRFLAITNKTLIVPPGIEPSVTHGTKTHYGRVSEYVKLSRRLRTRVNTETMRQFIRSPSHSSQILWSSSSKGSSQSLFFRHNDWFRHFAGNMYGASTPSGSNTADSRLSLIRALSTQVYDVSKQRN